MKRAPCGAGFACLAGRWGAERVASPRMTACARVSCAVARPPSHGAHRHEKGPSRGQFERFADDKGYMPRPPLIMSAAIILHASLTTESGVSPTVEDMTSFARFHTFGERIVSR